MAEDHRPVEIECVIPPNTIRPAGHYSPSTIHNGVVYIAGQLPIDPTNGNKIQGSIEEQTAQVLANLDRILIASRSHRSLVLQTTIFIADVALWENVNKVYANYFGDHRPARAVIPTTPLNHGFLIELTAIAAVAT